MTRKPGFVVAVVSIILLVYCIICGFGLSFRFAFFIFSLSPFLMIWLAYSVIRYGRYEGRELDEDDEWGYQDRSNEELDIM